MKALSISRLLLTVICLLYLSLPAAAADSGSDPLKDRMLDVIIIKCNKFMALQCEPIKTLRLMSVKDGKPQAIPFQIDKKNKKDNYIFPEDKAAKADDYSLLDENDELVFMASDVGEVWDAQTAPLEHQKGYGVEVTNPKNGKSGYAYFLSFTAPPPLSPVDYVKFEEKNLEVRSANYRYRFDKKVPCLPAMNIITPEGGGDGRDILDTLQVDFYGKAMRGIVTLRKTHRDIIAAWTGLIDGPVRVIYATVTHINLFWKFRSWPFPQKAFFYRNRFSIPVSVEMPFDADKFLTSGRMKIGIAFNPNAYGIRVYNDRNPQGTVIDGKMSEVEQRLDLREFRWLVLASGNPQAPGSWLFNMKVSAGGAKPNLYYQDGPSHELPARPNEPDTFFACGYILPNLEKLKKCRINFDFHTVQLPSYSPGSEKFFTDTLDYPLKTKISNL